MTSRETYIQHLLAVIQRKDDEIAALKETLSRVKPKVVREKPVQKTKRLGLTPDLRMTILED